MCGLVGVAGNLEFRDEALLRRLLLFDYLRGPDSTGLAAIRNDGTPKIAKLASHPIDLFDSTSFKSTLSGAQSKAFLGHNRSATKGAVNGLNAHPFTFGNITGAHNGTLTYGSQWDLEDALGEKYDVDSMAIFAAINALGVEETIGMLQEGSTSADGAWALTWHDKEDNSLNFLRNAHRPLWYAFTDDFRRIIWASEWKFIDAAISTGTGGFKINTEGKDNVGYFQFEKDVHYKFDLDVLSAGGKTRPKPLVKALKGKEPVAAKPGRQDPFGRDSMHHIGTPSGGSDGKTTQTIRKSKSSSSEPGNVVHLFGTASDPFAGIITRVKFDELAKYGCSFCSSTIEYGDLGVTVFEKDDIVLCNKCSGGKSEAMRVYVSDIEAFK
jgi:predicted glutamine amidotransferase